MSPDACVRIDEWLLTPERLAIHVPTATGVVADVHLGYHEARIGSGDALPIPSLADQLEPLAKSARLRGLNRLVVAGDLFERRFDAEQLQAFQEFLGTHGIELAGVVPGNHDRGFEAFHDRCPLFPDGIMLGRWRVVHDTNPGDEPTVMGHWHPRLGRRPCYVLGPKHLVLPAFSYEAAGVTVRGVKRWRGFRAYGIDRGQVANAAHL